MVERQDQLTTPILQEKALLLYFAKVREADRSSCGSGELRGLDPRRGDDIECCFNSQDFIFLFLPACLLFTYALARVGSLTAGKIGLILASLAFYAYWRIDHVWIILLSLTVNYPGIRLVERLGSKPARSLGVAPSRYLQPQSYWGVQVLQFHTDQLQQRLRRRLRSGFCGFATGYFIFFPSNKISYVIDFHRGGRRLAVLFFPHLIAGPIVKYRALIDQFNPSSKVNKGQVKAIGDVETSDGKPVDHVPAAVDARARLFRPTAIGVAIGVTIFALGLFKKVFLADSFSAFADQVFTAAELAAPLSTLDAWIGPISFFFQIYFDFSGYTDMAIGLALFFGVALPVNFLSPYTSRSIIEFWRRWHITLSTFLRDYVYISWAATATASRAVTSTCF